MLTHLRRSSGRAGRFNVGRSDCATRRAQVLRSVTLATVLAAVVVAVTPAPVAAEPGSYIKSNVKSVPVLGNPPTVDIPLRYRCAPSEPFARIWVSVAQWQYNGVVLTDDLEMHAIIDHYGVEDATVRAILAGCDMPLICKDRHREVAAISALDKAVADGTVTGERLEQSLARIARLKEHYLLPYRPVLISDARLIVGCRSHRALLRSIHQARERSAHTLA